MNLSKEELIQDLARIESYNTGETKWVVWDITKLLYVYRKLLENK